MPSRFCMTQTTARSVRRSTFRFRVTLSRGLLALAVSYSVLSSGPAGVFAADGELATPELPAKENFHLYLLVGQSNMAGRGKVTEQDKETHPRVLVFNKQGKWAPAVDPLHFDKPGIAGVGLGKSFAVEMGQGASGCGDWPDPFVRWAGRRSAVGSPAATIHRRAPIRGTTR